RNVVDDGGEITIGGRIIVLPATAAERTERRVVADAGENPVAVVGNRDVLGQAAESEELGGCQRRREARRTQHEAHDPASSGGPRTVCVAHDVELHQCVIAYSMTLMPNA